MKVCSRRLAVLTSLLLAACASTPPTQPPAPVQPVASEPAAEPPPTPQTPQEATPSHPEPSTPVSPPAARALGEAEGRALLLKLLPPKMPDRKGWADDIMGAFTGLKLPYTAENFCAAAAVIEQESTWQGDPVVPGLPRIVWGKIEEKADRLLIPMTLVKAALLKPSADGRSYKTRIDTLRTEREMNALYEELAGEARRIGLPMEMKNPIRTGGPMQVSVDFAIGHASVWPYPYPRNGSWRGEVFSRRGGTYFGIANLLHYPAPYTQMLYRFADYNAGRYSSRNAAFQQVVSRLSGQELVPDGDLLLYGDNGQPTGKTSSTQRALYAIAGRLGLSAAEMDRDLRQEKLSGFGQSALYRKVYAIAGPGAAREALPQIDLKSPKITRKLTTEWFARRVEGRYETCLKRR